MGLCEKALISLTLLSNQNAQSRGNSRALIKNNNNNIQNNSLLLAVVVPAVVTSCPFSFEGIFICRPRRVVPIWHIFINILRNWWISRWFLFRFVSIIMNPTTTSSWTTATAAAVCSVSAPPTGSRRFLGSRGVRRWCFGRAGARAAAGSSDAWGEHCILQSSWEQEKLVKAVMAVVLLIFGTKPAIVGLFSSQSSSYLILPRSSPRLDFLLLNMSEECGQIHWGLIVFRLQKTIIASYKKKRIIPVKIHLVS